VVVSTAGSRPRNPGPAWGYAFLQNADRWLPRWVFRPGLMLGTWVALPFMPAPRRHSREFLTLVLGRPPGLVEVWRHFFAFVDFLMLKLRVARGVPHACRLDPAHGAAFEALVRSGRPALFGTFHFGHSDLLGFLLSDYQRPVSIVRLRVGNSDDTRWLGRLFGHWVSFIWVNDPASLLFALKGAMEAGRSLAMQCDRLEFSSKTESFDFLGRRRVFPFTIYHLSILFDQPVMFSVGVPDGRGATLVVASEIFAPDPADRVGSLGRARLHFQAVLTQLETLVRQHPTLWFNFLPLNPESSLPPTASSSS
jgi:predicted LPLAT superfamily acyltransferase